MPPKGAVTRAVRSIRRLAPGEIAAILRMACLVLALPVLQRTLSLPQLMKLLDSSRRTKPTGDPTRRLYLARGLLDRNIGPFRPKCYTQSLILFRDLRRLGHDVTVRFAISEKDGELDGHSWIELDGVPFGEEQDPRPLFNVIYSYPADQNS